MTSKQKAVALAAALTAAFIAVFLIYGTPSFAADKAGLGGNCCSDLEERIAELEATTAKKGNRKISLTVSGTVNESILHWADNDVLGKANTVIEPNGINPNRLTFTGEAKFGNGYSAGFVIEVGAGSWDALGGRLGVNSEQSTYVRQSAVFLSSPVGKVTVGKTAEATYRVADISVANVHDADEMLSLSPILGGSPLTQNVDIYSGQFLDILRYDSPLMAGFVVSASWSTDGTKTAFAGSNAPSSIWDIALRYSGEVVRNWKVAAGIGYRDGAVFEGFAPILPIPVVAFDQKTFSGSASVMEITTGLFLDVSAGQADFNGTKVTSWEIRPGVEEKWFPLLGKSTLFAEYASVDVDGLSDKVTWYGAGVNQAIDAASMNLYLVGKEYQPGNGADNFMTVMGGAAIHF